MDKAVNSRYTKTVELGEMVQKKFIEKSLDGLDKFD